MNQQKMNSLRILKDQDVNIYYDVAMMTSQKSDSENLVEPATRKEKKNAEHKEDLNMPEVRKSLGPYIILGQPLRTYKKDLIRKIPLSKFPRASGLHMCLSPPLPSPNQGIKKQPSSYQETDFCLNIQKVSSKDKRPCNTITNLPK